MAVTQLSATDLVVKINDIEVLCANSAELTIDREMLEAVCGASGNFTDYTPGRIDWSMSADALFRVFTTPDATTNVSAQNVATMLLAGTKVSVSFGTTVTGGFTFEGESYVNSFSASKEVDGVPSWSAGFQGTGALTITPVA
ncbi:hypothetical protein [Nibribacter koreensis]|uniref:Phage tail tube protein n=1 Tax=Nibribacter koreensis TaxID=1084519 RepID=A0ABP8FB71_9BACT